jgi:predicted transglutaminase-like cysteine proteinase
MRSTVPVMFALALAFAAPTLATASGSAAVAISSAVSAPIQEGRPMMAPMGYIVYCMRNRAACQPSTGLDRLKAGPELRLALARVNDSVNAAILPRRDTGKGYAADHWDFAPAAGDCKDFALTKRQRLIDAGWSARSLRLAIARTPSGEGHTVLVVRTDRGDLVLDNRHAAIRDWRDTDLAFIGIQSARNPKLWNSTSPRSFGLLASKD